MGNNGIYQHANPFILLFIDKSKSSKCFLDSDPYKRVEEIKLLLLVVQPSGCISLKLTIVMDIAIFCTPPGAYIRAKVAFDHFGVVFRVEEGCHDPWNSFSGDKDQSVNTPRRNDKMVRTYTIN